MYIQKYCVNAQNNCHKTEDQIPQKYQPPKLQKSTSFFKSKYGKIDKRCHGSVIIVKSNGTTLN